MLDRLQLIAGKSKKPEEEKKKEEKSSKKPVVVAPEKPKEKDNKKESQKENKTEKRSDSQERSVADRKRRHHRETKTKEEPKRSASPRPPSRNSKHPRIEAPSQPHGSRSRKHVDDEIQLDHNEIKDDLDFEIATAGAFQPGIVRKDRGLSRTATAGILIKNCLSYCIYYI